MHECCSALHALQTYMVGDNILVSVDYRITLTPCKSILILCAHRTVDHAYNNCFIKALRFYCEQRNELELLA